MTEEIIVDEEDIEKRFEDAFSLKGLKESENLVLRWAKDLVELEEPTFENLPNYDFLRIGGGVFEINPNLPEEDPWRKKQEETNFQARSLVNYTIREFYYAICKGDERYQEEVKVLQKNGSLLFAAIAGYLASQLGFAVAALTAIAAAVFRLIAKAGHRALCEFGEDRYN